MKEVPPYINTRLVGVLTELLKAAESGELLSVQFTEWRKGNVLDFYFIAAPEHDLDDLIPALSQELLELRLRRLAADPDSILYADD